MTIAYVQGVGVNAGNSQSTTMASTALSVTSGNALIVGVRWESVDNDTATAVLSDNAGNTYTLGGYVNTGGTGENQRIGLFYCLSSTEEAALVVTATISGSRSYRQICVAEYSHESESLLAITTEAEGGSATNVTAWEASSAVPLTAGDLAVTILGVYNSGKLPTTVDSGDVRLTAGVSTQLLTLTDYIASGTESFTSAGDLTGADTWALKVVGFEEGTVISKYTMEFDETVTSTDFALGWTFTKNKGLGNEEDANSVVAITTANSSIVTLDVKYATGKAVNGVDTVHMTYSSSVGDISSVASGQKLADIASTAATQVC